jgi:polyisoprenoid-binding protein YceI
MLRIVFVLLSLQLVMLSRVQGETAMGMSVTGVQTIHLSNKVGKNQIKFVSDAPMEKIHGTGSDISGEIRLDPTNLEGTTGQIRLGVASMETGIDQRDGHLHSKDWLDEKTFPTIVFEVKSLQDVSVKVDKDKARVKAMAIADVALHGVIRALKVPVEITYLLASEKTKKRAEGDFFVVKGKFQIALKDFEISGARGFVGNRVGTEIDLEANLFGSTQAPAEKE